MAPRSAVWSFFSKIENGSKVKCKECESKGTNFTLQFKTSTSMMFLHVESVHKVTLPKQIPSGGKSKRKRIEVEEETVDEDDDLLGEVSEVEQEYQSPSCSRRGSQSSSASTSTQSSHVASSASAARPGTLTAIWKEMNSFADGGSRNAKVTDALLFMIAHDNMPLRTPEKRGFRVFCKKLNSRYEDSEPTTTKKLGVKYRVLRSKVKIMLKQAESYSLTTDIYTHKNTTVSYLGFTIHFYRGSKEITLEISCRPLRERKTIFNLAKIMRSVHEEWGIEVDKVDGITTDGGANIKGAAKEVYGVNKHFSCMGHILNLIGSKALGLHGSKPRPSEIEVDAPVEPDLPENESDIDDEDEEDGYVEARGQAGADGTPDNSAMLGAVLRKTKKIVTFFRKSEVATSELVKLQIEGTNKTENDAKRLINECRTRWSSGEAMCERFLELSDPVGRTLMKVSLDKSSRSVPPDMLTVSELSSLTDAQTLLRPLTLTTKSLSSAKTVSISKIIPMINSMQSRIQKFQPSTPVGFNLKQTLLDDIKKFFGNIERTSLYAAATLLDPRFKRVPFNSDVAIAEGMGYIAKLMNERMNAVRCEAETEAETNRIFGGLDDPEQVAEPDDDSDDLLASFDQKAKDFTARNAANREPITGIPAELKQYLALPVVNRKANPNVMLVLEGLKETFPNVCAVARRILNILATSTPCERLFSHAGMIGHQLRCRMLGRRLNELVFLMSVDEEDWFSEFGLH